jgi:exosortase A
VVPTTHTASRVLGEKSARSAWLAAGASLVVAALALCLIFADEAEGAYRVWIGSTAYNHCFLILPVALYLGWARRSVLASLSPQPNLRALLLVLPLGLLWLIFALISVLELRQLTVVAMFQIIALGVLGWAAYRAMLMPFLYLFFLVPTGYFLVPYLQEWTAAFAVAGLHLVGIPVYSDGMLIEVPSGNFVVAEACAGLRFLIASAAFGVLFSTLIYRSRIRWIAFVALSIVVPIIANGFRAFGIIVLSEVTGNATAVEADHIIYGWVFFSAVTLLLIVIGLKFSDEFAPDKRFQSQSHAQPRAPRPWSAVIAGAVGIALAASGPAYAQFRNWQAGDVALDGALASPPMGLWKPTSRAPISWKPVIEEPDREYFDTYSDGNADVQLYLALYRDTGLHNNLVRSVNDIVDGKRWRLVTSGVATARIGGKDSAIATSEITGDGQRLLVWHFYVVNGQIVASPLHAKLLQLRYLFRPTGIDAFVAVAAEEGVAGHPPDETLRGFLAAFSLPGS